MIIDNIKGEEEPSQQDLLPLIQAYLGASLFRHAQKYQSITHNHAQYLEFTYQKVPIYSQQDAEPILQASLQSLIKQQPKFGSKMRILRILQYNHVLHCLAMDESMLVNDDKFSIIAIVFENKQAANLWKNKYSFLTKICITGYFKSLYKFSAHSLCNILVTRLQNILVESCLYLQKYDSEVVRVHANNKFREKNYMQALVQYELGLGLMQNPQKKRERAILYANSSQCLFEMKLYGSALTYASISMTLDRAYIKGIYKRFCCLLELKMFKQVSSVMMAINQASSTEFQKAKSIFHKHHLHSIGLFDWKQIFSGLPLNFGDYLSEKVKSSKAEFLNNLISNFVAIESIKPFEMIIFSKPLVYQTSQQSKFKKQYVFLTEQVKKWCKLDDQFRQKFRMLPSQCEIQGRILKFNKTNPEGIEDNQIHSKFLRCLQNEKILSSHSGKQEFIGIWQPLHRFKHSCIPNCTYIHIKGGLAVFSLKRIREGEDLTLDFLNDDTKNRSLKLKEKLGKVCECAFCEWDWNYDFQASGQLLYDFYKGEKNRLIEGGLQKISLFFLWELIFKKQYNEVELIKEYLLLLEKYPLWECIINCLNYLRVSRKNDAFDLIKSSIKKLFQKFFKMSHPQAVQLLKTLL